MVIITCLARLCRALRRPAAGPPPKMDKPAAGAGRPRALVSMALGKAATTIISLLPPGSKRYRARRDARLRRVLVRVVNRQRGEAAGEC